MAVDEGIRAHGYLIASEPSHSLANRLVVLACRGDDEVTASCPTGPGSLFGSDARLRLCRPGSVVSVNLPVVDAADPRLDEVRLLDSTTALELTELAEGPVLHAVRAMLVDQVVDVAHVKKSSSILGTR